MSISAKNKQKLVELAQIVNQREALLRSFNIQKLMLQYNILLDIKIVLKYLNENPQIGANKISKFVYLNEPIAVLDFNGFTKTVQVTRIPSSFLLKSLSNYQLVDQLFQMVEEEKEFEHVIVQISQSLSDLLNNQKFDFKLLEIKQNFIQLKFDDQSICVSFNLASKNKFVMNKILDQIVQ